MIKEDLEYIFERQIIAGSENLYFMLIDGDCKRVERHPTDKIEELLPMLSSFDYAGSEVIPRFVK